jgi:hypothetical protein
MRAAFAGRPRLLAADSFYSRVSSTMIMWKRLAWRPVIGLMIDRQRISLSVVAKTLMGRKEIARETQAYEGESVQKALEPLLKPWLGKRSKIGPWVHIALPEAGVFQTIVPITEANRNATPQAVFLEAVAASNLRAEDRIIDLLKLEVNKQSLACVAACPRATIESLVAMMSQLGTRVGCAESAPIALFRAGNAHQRAPRGSKLCVRFFLGRPFSIGILGLRSQALCWHPFELPEGDETKSILAAFSTLWMVGRHSRITLPIDSMIVHGLPELKLGVDTEGFRTRTGAQFLRSPGPVYDASSIAMGAALADPLDDEPRQDLARDIKPAVLIRDVFPWAELALHGVLVGAMSIFLAGNAAEAHAKLKSIEIERASFSWLKKQEQGKLDTEKKALEERLKAAELFKNTRVNWSGSVRTVAAAAPDNTTVTNLLGEGEVEVATKSGKSVVKKQLVVSLNTPVSDEVSVPQEIDSFLAVLRAEPTLKKHFSLIEVTNLKIQGSTKDQPAMASYSIVCLPRKAATPPPATKKAKAEKSA